MKRGIVVLCLLLAGCAANEMTVSAEAYKACLKSHESDVKACEAARLTYETDLAAYNAKVRAIAALK